MVDATQPHKTEFPQPILIGWSGHLWRCCATLLMLIFREMIPDLQRILFPYDAADPEHLLEAKAFRAAARHLGIVLMERPLRTEVEVETALAKLKPESVDGILAPRCCSLNLPGFILDAGVEKNLPTMFQQAFWVERGALASYGPDYSASGRQAARLVDKILKGTNPANIPVETNSEIEFVINQNAANAIGLTIAPEVLFQADRIIRDP